MKYSPSWILLLLVAGTACVGETAQLDTGTPSAAFVSSVAECAYYALPVE